MATEIATVVDAGGTGDYVSVALAEADWCGATSGALLTNNEWCNVRLRCTNGNADPGPYAQFAGWTNSSADCYIKLWTDPADVGGDGPSGSYRHWGKFPTAGQKIFRMASFQWVLTITGVWVEIYGLALRMTGNGSAAIACLQVTGTMSAKIAYNYMDCTVASGTYGKFGISASQTNGFAKIWNNTCCRFATTAASVGIYVLGSGVGSLFYVYDNTVFSCAYGIMKGNINGTAIAKGNVVIACTDCWYGTWQAGTAKNGYDEGADPGTGGVDLSAYTDAQIFLDPVNYDLHQAVGSPLKGAGINLATDAYIAVTDDIDREARKATPDLGADEVPGNEVPVVVEVPGGSVRPGAIDRGRQKRERSRVARQEETRRVRDISKAFMGMYRRLDGNRG